MSTCQTCYSADARATKAECPACYEYRRYHKGTPRPEDTIIKNNQRRHEQDTLRRRRLS